LSDKSFDCIATFEIYENENKGTLILNHAASHHHHAFDDTASQKDEDNNTCAFIPLWHR
jgi:hypothetical protein